MAQINICDYKVFFDFDNTISNLDVVDAFLEKFAVNDSWQGLEKKWQQGEIGSEECLRGQISICTPTKQALADFLNAIKIDPSFTKLISLLRQNNIFYAIVSDSFEYFIKHILKGNGIKNIPIYANKLEINDNKVFLSFPNKSKRCFECANCKKERLNLGPKKKTIYVGDGQSDMCAAKHCDIVFAKGRLLKFGQDNNLNWLEFKDMNDIINKIDNTKLIFHSEKFDSIFPCSHPVARLN